MTEDMLYYIWDDIKSAIPEFAKINDKELTLKEEQTLNSQDCCCEFFS